MSTPITNSFRFCIFDFKDNTNAALANLATALDANIGQITDPKVRVKYLNIADAITNPDCIIGEFFVGIEQTTQDDAPRGREWVRDPLTGWFWTRQKGTTTGTEAAVIADIARRQQVGIAKYGTTVRDNPLSLRQWLQHAYEETLDQAVYLKRAIEEMDKPQPETPQ